MPILATFDPSPDERRFVEERLPVRWLIDGADPAGCDGMLSLWPRREFQKAGMTWLEVPDIRWVKVITAGVNHIGWPDIPEHVTVMSTPAATGDAIAEYVLGAVIAWARGFQASTRDIHAGRFYVGQLVRAVSELKVGIVGHGGLGQAIAATLVRQGAEVRAVSRSGEARMDIPVAPMERLPDLARWADVLVLAIPLVNDTLHLVDAPLLDAFGDGLLVNVARGLIVDEEALRTWLVAEPAKRWAHLDVWWQYPKGGGRPYGVDLDLPNVTCTPHNSPNTTGFRMRMLGRACDDLQHLAKTGQLRYVEPRAAYVMPRDGDGR